METFNFIFMRQTVREKNFDQAFCKAEMLNKSLSNNDLNGAVINHALIHTHPHPPQKKRLTSTHTQPKKGHTYPHPAKKGRHPLPPHQAKKRSHPPTPSQEKEIPTQIQL